MRMRHLPAIIVAALSPVTSVAVPVTYEFSGQFTGAAGRTPPDGGEFVPLVPFGTEFNASFTYDSATLPAYDAQGWRIYLNPITAASISLGSGGSLGVFNFAARPDDIESSRISLLNDLAFGGSLPFDELDIGASLGNQPDDPAHMRRWMSFGTWDPTALQLTGEETLGDPLSLPPSVFHQFTFGYSLWDDAGVPVDQASVDSQQVTVRRVTSVPEPGTWSLFAVGLAGVWVMTRRRIEAQTRRY
jgi:hypothetical protein